MKAGNHLLIIFLVMLFFHTRAAAQNPTLLFIHPLEENEMISKTEEKYIPQNRKMDKDKSSIKHLDINATVRNEVKKCKFWIWKTFTPMDNGWIIVSYELETKQKETAAGEYDPLIKGTKIPLGVYSGSMDSEGEEGFEWWFENSIAQYCKRLLREESISFKNVVCIGKMVEEDQLSTINDLPNHLYRAFLKCKLGANDKTRISFTLNYIITLDMSLKKVTDRYFNINIADDYDPAKGKITLNISQRNAKPFKALAISLNQMDKDITTAVNSFAEEILKKNN